VSDSEHIIETETRPTNTVLYRHVVVPLAAVIGGFVVLSGSGWHFYERAASAENVLAEKEQEENLKRWFTRELDLKFEEIKLYMQSNRFYMSDYEIIVDFYETQDRLPTKQELIRLRQLQ